MTRKEKAVTGALLCHTIFIQYKKGELTALGEGIKKKIVKFLTREQDRAYFSSLVTTTDIAWKKTLDKYEKEERTIEAQTTIMLVANYFEPEFKRYLSISPKAIEKFMAADPTQNITAAENTKIIFHHILKELDLDIPLSLSEKMRIKHE